MAASAHYLENHNRSVDEEIVAVVENDACGVDGIQALLGCTFGKGNLLFRDHGKSVYTFFNRGTGKGMRYSFKGIMRQGEDEQVNELIDRVRSEEATEEERRRFSRLWVERAVEVLKRGADGFEITESSGPVPIKARIFGSVKCEGCGETVGAHRIVDTEDGMLCIPCSESGVVG